MYALTPYPITPIGNFIGVVLALLPLVSQVRKLSLAVWGYAIWIAIFCFQMFVNTIIWHDNTNNVAPVWCDIVTKLQVGASIGTRACAFAICLHLYKITRVRPSYVITREQRRRSMICDLLIVLGIPVLIMALFIIVQPIRFDIFEELGCYGAVYSYVGYIIEYVPEVILSFGCAILAPLTIRTFLQHRKEMNEFLSSDKGITQNKYHRLMVVACLDTLFNVPVLMTIIITEITKGEDSSLNYPYVSWKNVHDGAGGLLPGLSLSSVAQTPASAWSSDPWDIFNVKWDEWVYVAHALIFFSVFGTTPEMRAYYRSAICYIPEQCGYKCRRTSALATVSDVTFSSTPGFQAEIYQNANRRRGSLSFLESAIEASDTQLGSSLGFEELEVKVGDDNVRETVSVRSNYDTPISHSPVRIQDGEEEKIIW